MTRSTLAVVLTATGLGGAAGSCGRTVRTTTPVPSTDVHTDSRFRAPPGPEDIILLTEAPAGDCALLANLVGESSWWSVEEEVTPLSQGASAYVLQAELDARKKAVALGATHLRLDAPEIENRYLDVVSIRISGTAYRCPQPGAGPPAQRDGDPPTE
ncbi:MAG: hypothetical protein HY907_12220 [Deltaproteobacteria bacterium]|nr:hypothetical protein [Deltaproteobacteria bacterium]